MGKPSDIYNRHRNDIRAIASHYPVANIRIFGSVLHGTDNDRSDIDLLVDTLPGTTLLDLGGLQDELQSLLGVDVDLLTPGDLPAGVREHIISEAKPVCDDLGDEQMKKTPLTEKELLEGLDGHTSHADEAATPLPQELDPLERLKGSVLRYERPFDGLWDGEPTDDES